MKILITGANGQLGRCIRGLAPQSGDRFLFTDVVEAEGLQTEMLDITDLEAVRRMVAAEGIEAVVNCAAYTNVDAAESNRELAERLNALAPENLAIAMKEVDGLLVHISTDYVFGGDPYNTPCREDQKGTPTGVYGLTKLHGEERIAAVGGRWVIIRTAWLYSEFGKNFCKTMLQLTATKPQLKVVFDQVGTPTYAGDLAEAVMGIVEAYEIPRSSRGMTEESNSGMTGESSRGMTDESNSGMIEGSSRGMTGESSLNPNTSFHGLTVESPQEAFSGIYHFSNEGVCSWYDFAKMIAEYAGHNGCEISPCHSDEFPSPVKRPAYSVLDKTKIKETFGITVPYWTDSLKKCIENIKSQENK